MLLGAGVFIAIWAVRRAVCYLLLGVACMLDIGSSQAYWPHWLASLAFLIGALMMIREFSKRPMA